MRSYIDAGYADLNFRGEVQIDWRLAELLEKQGRAEEAKRVRRFGLNPDGSIANEDPETRNPSA